MFSGTKKLFRPAEGTPRFWRSLLEKCCQKLVAAQVGGLVAIDADAELVVIAGQNGVEDHAAQSSDGQTGQSHSRTAHGEGHAAHGAEAEAADKHDGGNDQVPGLGQINLILHDVADAHGGDHAVEDEADAAHDGGGDGVHQRVELGGEAEDDGVDGSQTDHAGIVDLGKSQHAGVFAVGGVGGAAEHTGKGGCQTVARQGAVQAGIGDEVIAGGGGNGGDIADVLHHGSDGDGGHHQDGGNVELGDDELLEADQVGHR